MKSFPVTALALLSDSIEELVRSHLGPHAGFVLVVRAGEQVNCISNLPTDSGEELRSIFAELASRPVKPFPHENN